MYLRALIIGLLSLGRFQPAQAEPINVILIVADDLGRNDLGCFGQERIKTPKIDALASRGMKFEVVYAASSIDSPARWGLLTGRDSFHLAKPDPTIAATLKKHGYVTAFTGRWGIEGIEPRDAGFDRVVIDADRAKEGQLYPEAISVDGETIALKNEVYTDTDGTRRRKRVDYVNDQFAKQSLNFITTNHDKPFGLVFAPAIPAVNPTRTDRDLEPPTGENPYDKERWPEAEKAKAFAISRLDDYVGEIAAKLDELRLIDRTLIILTSDTPSREGGNTSLGFFYSNSGSRGKPGELFEGSLRVPLIMTLPNKIAAGNNNQTWGVWEVVPAIQTLVGLDAPKDPSLMVKAFDGKKVEGVSQRYFCFRAPDGTVAVRWQNWKYIRPPKAAPVLFNLIGDLAESRDVSRGEARIAEAMEAHLNDVEKHATTLPK